MHTHALILPGFRTRFDHMGIRWMTTPVDGGGTSGTSTEPAQSATDGSEALGDPGKRALDRMKGERNAAQADLKSWTDLGVTADQVRVLLAQQAPAQDAVEQAREEGRAEVRAVLAGERVMAAFDKALTGRSLNAAALLDFDRSRFVRGDSADTAAITAWVEKNSTEVKAPPTGVVPESGNREPDRGKGSVQAGRDLWANRHSKKK